MNDRGWEELIDIIDQKFTITDHVNTKEPIKDNPTLSQNVESVEFERDNTKYKLRRISGPAIIDKKTNYHKSGVSSHAQYIYDPAQITHRLEVLKMVADGSWETIEPDMLLR